MGWVNTFSVLVQDKQQPTHIVDDQHDMIELPSILTANIYSMDDFIAFVYPNVKDHVKSKDFEYWFGRRIISPIHAHNRRINSRITNQFDHRGDTVNY